MIGRRLGRYRIVSKLTEGGMGAVYLATHELMGREVVVKVLLPEMSTQRDIVQRFFNEARATGNLNHPGIVAIFDLDYAEDGRAYIVMERLQGETLHHRLRRIQRLTVEETVYLTRQLAGALEAAHGQGVVHRDLKPGNIFLIADPEVRGRERAKVLDFGVAKLALQQSSLVTHAGALVGTAAYMAPEQCRDSASVDHRADLYALGCVMYACLCGRPPFVGGTIEVLAAQLRDVPNPPRALNPSVPPWLDSLIMRLLEKDLGHRVQSCAALIEAIDSSAGLQVERARSDASALAATNKLAKPVAPQHQIKALESEDEHATTQRNPVQATTSSTVSMANSAAALIGNKNGYKLQIWLGVGSATLITFGLLLYLGLRSEAPSSPASTSQVPEQLVVAIPPSEAGKIDHPQATWEDANDGTDEAEVDLPQPASTLSDGTLTVLLQEAQGAMESKDWSQAMAKASEALQLVPEHSRASEILATAEREKANALRFLVLEKALKGWDLEKAASELDAISEDSVYRQPAEAKLARARDKYRKTLAKSHSSGNAGAAASASPRIEPDDSTNNRKPAQSGNVAVENPVKIDVPATADRQPASSNQSLDDILSQAEQEARSGRYGSTHRLCQQALAIQPKHPRAVELCAIAACNLGYVDFAKNYYAMTNSKKELYQLCLFKGIDLKK